MEKTTKTSPSVVPSGNGDILDIHPREFSPYEIFEIEFKKSNPRLAIQKGRNGI